MRQRYQCTQCGLRLSGRLIKGVIYAYDRAPDDDTPVQPCVCIECREALNGEIAGTIRGKP